MEVLSPKVGQRIRNLRDAIEHMDVDILGDRFEPNVEPALHVGWDRVTLHHHEATYAELARWIRSLYEYAAKLSRFVIIFGPPKPVGTDAHGV